MRRHEVPLVGSKGERGRRTYAKTLERNLFEPLSADANAEYGKGDGGELGRQDGNPGKMQALHSSSALCCNVFHCWQRAGRPDVVARACGVPDANAAVTFEQQLPIDVSQFRYPPNLDAVFRYENGSIDVIGVESKFSELFSARAHLGLVLDKFAAFNVSGRAGAKHADEIEQFISRLDQNVDHVTVLIHRAPEILALTVDGHEDLVQEPRVSEPTLSSLQAPSVVGADLPAPLPTLSYDTMIPRSASRSSTSRKLRQYR